MIPQSMARADWLRLILLSMLWGGSFYFNALAVPHMPAITIVWARVSLAALIVAGLVIMAGARFPAGWKSWGALLYIGTFNCALPFTLIVVAQGTITSATASILNATAPLFTVVVAHLLTREERMTRGKVAGLAVGFAGVAVMMGGAAFAARTDVVIAQLCSLGAAASYAFGSVRARRLGRAGMAPVTLAFGQIAMAALVLTPLMLVVDRPWTLPMPPLPAWLAIGALATLSTALAYHLYFKVLAAAGAVNVQLVTFLVPVSAVLLGVALLGESLGLRQVAGMVLIGLGLVALDGRVWRR